MATRKRKPWNAEPGRLSFPSLEGREPHKVEPTEALPGLLGHSTGTHFECLRCEQIRDGREPLVPDHSPRCAYRGTGRDPDPSG